MENTLATIVDDSDEKSVVKVTPVERIYKPKSRSRPTTPLSFSTSQCKLDISKLHRRRRSVSPTASSVRSFRAKDCHNNELLDIDSIKEISSFQTKTSRGNPYVFWKVFFKALVFPLYFRWWLTKDCVRWKLLSFYCLLYFLHLLFVLLHLLNLLGPCVISSSEKSRCDLYLPVVLLVLTSCGYARLQSETEIEPLPSNITSNNSTPVNRVNNTNNSSNTNTTSSNYYHHSNNCHLSHCSNSCCNIGNLLLNSNSSSGSTSTTGTRLLATRSSNSSLIHSPSSDSETDSETEEPIEDGLEDPDNDVWPQHAMSVNVYRWTANGERVKSAMSLQDLRIALAAKADETLQHPLYPALVWICTLSACLLPTLFQFYRHLEESFFSSSESVPVSDTICDFSYVSASVFFWFDVLFRLFEQRLSELSFCVVAYHTMGITSLACVFVMALQVFRVVAEAELTFVRRVTYAKAFKSLTSSKRAMRFSLPFFSLKNTLNIKVWLALRGGRGWLSRQKHQRAADISASITFICVICLSTAVVLSVFGGGAVGGGNKCKSPKEDRELVLTLVLVEIISWDVLLSIFLLRLMILGARVNAKYIDSTVLVTEQINIQMRILDLDPLDKEKKEKLQAANNVLKLAVKLLRDVGSPNKISGFAMNRLLYNMMRVILLSALSSALSGPLGFNVRLWTIAKLK